MSGISNHINSLHKGLMEWSASLYGFTDGSMLLNSVIEGCAGIGGIYNMVTIIYCSSFLVRCMLILFFCGVLGRNSLTSRCER